MDQVEQERLRDYIKSKKVKGAEITPQRQVEIDRVIAECAAQLKITQTGPNSFSITVRDVETGLRGGVPSDRGNEIIFAGTLTKSVLMALPEASFILSNICHPDATPIFVQRVGEQARRQELWLNLRSLRLQGRGFFVFATEESLQAELARRKEAFARHQARA